MADKSSDLVQGTLEMLVLKTLASGSMHGYGITLRIEQMSQGVFQVNPGSLFPALSRMERAGSIKAEWRATENNRRARYYQLTAVGQKQLEVERMSWLRASTAINGIMSARLAMAGGDL